MCGVFGFVSKGKQPVNLRILQEVAAITELRGPHAWGLAWVTADGEINTFKQQGRITDSLGMLAMAEGARLLVGHCRYATHGDPANNANNHPHDGGDAAVVHNGQIHHYRSIARSLRLRMQTECDSEVLGLMLKKFRGTPIKRMTRACSEAVGLTPFASLAIWPDRVLAARANKQPLHIGETAGGVWLASLRHGLPGSVTEFPESKVVEFEAKKIATRRRTKQAAGAYKG
jgi:glucosamine 6-phosphate synthetase-like amidotransferase/phosphosugar isomerase protein